MNKIGIFVDTSDLYHKVRRKFSRDDKVCYETYYANCENSGEIVESIAYGMRNETCSFTNCLNIIGFMTKFKLPRIFTVSDRKIKKCDWNVSMTIDIVEFVLKHRPNSVATARYSDGTTEEINVSGTTIILGSSNSLLVPLIKWIKSQGIKVVIFASCIPRSMKEVADSWSEIDEECLEMEEEEE